jgi:pimeloyl-ACP methyl ester carboxylesterase
MAVFVCLHGAGGHGAYWDLVAAELAPLGHEVVAPDLPCDREVGLDAYVDTAVAAIGDRRDDLVLVAQSLAGLVAPLVATRVDVDLMVLVAAMVPRPGEPGGEWWAATGHEQAFAAQDLPDDSPETVFVHDVPPEVLAAFPPPRDQTATLFEEPWPLDAWPDVPTRFIACRDDRFFPAAWLRGVVRDRLGIEPAEIPGGHCAFLSRPRALAAALVDCGVGRTGDAAAASRARPRR